jgi:lipopolysaccharide biosynthesis regulator YciM
MLRRPRPVQTLAPELPQDYLLGLNYLLNDETDQAIQVFIKLLEVNQNTVETHLALGALFRRRGELDKAIRIHQNLLARTSLPKQYVLAALYGLALDYLRSGVLDRAERLFQDLSEKAEEDLAYKKKALLHLLEVYEQEKSWDLAIRTARTMQEKIGLTMATRIAQYCCELAVQQFEKNNDEIALHLLQKALGEDGQCIRAIWLLAEHQREQFQYVEAREHYRKILALDSRYLSMALHPLVMCQLALNENTALQQDLFDRLAREPKPVIALALAECLQMNEGAQVALQFLQKYLKRHPTLICLPKFIELYQTVFGEAAEHVLLIDEILLKMVSAELLYRCSHCGFQAKAMHWYCPSCHQWAGMFPV